MATLKSGLVSVTFRQLSPEAILALASNAGLDAIEWGSDAHLPPGKLMLAERIGSATRDAGLAVAAYGSYYRCGERETAGHNFSTVLDTALALGAPTVRVWAGNTGSAQATGADRRRIIDDLLRITELTAHTGVRLALEFHADTLNDSVDAALELLGSGSYPHLTTYWQPPIGQDPVVAADGLRRLLPRLSNVHVFHWWPAIADRHPLGAGQNIWLDYLRVLRTSEREHFTLLEFVRNDDPGQLLADAAVLRDCLALSEECSAD